MFLMFFFCFIFFYNLVLRHVEYVINFRMARRWKMNLSWLKGWNLTVDISLRILWTQQKVIWII